MKKILISVTILLFSSVFAYAEKQKCRELPLGKAYFSCLKSKVGMGGNSSSGVATESNENTVKDDRSWYQKLKSGKPLLSE
jgi:hypothetical protein